MNASNLQMKLDFKSKVISKVEKFNRKHKALSFLGIVYAVVAITGYNFLFYFYRNTKRFTCLACIIMFFIASSSFSYPAMSLNISFASEAASGEEDGSAVAVLSGQEVAESSAELAVVEDVDQEVMAEASEVVNPDVAEIDNMVSLAQILEDNEGSEETVAVEETEDAETQVKDADAQLKSLEESEEVALSSSGNSSDSADVSFDGSDWNLLLVNKQHPIPDDYNFELGTISGSMRCDERIISPLLDMLKAARADGVNLIICSPYRDIERQTMLFTNKVDRYMGGGMSYMDAYNLASQAVTVPGSSEHQIGLAVDIITDGYSTLDEGFGDTAAGKWLAANSSDYGFILRYPSGKEEITSIEYEPWHFRYVGVDAAKVIADNDLCLEEFWNIYVD